MIVGWPTNVPFASPLAIGNITDMCTLYDAGISGSTQWIQMSKDQVKEFAVELEACQEVGEVVGKKQKQRSDAGIKKGPKKSKTAALTTEKENTGEDQVCTMKKGKAGTKCVSVQAQIAPANARSYLLSPWTDISTTAYSIIIVYIAIPITRE